MARHSDQHCSEGAWKKLWGIESSIISRQVTEMITDLSLTEAGTGDGGLCRGNSICKELEHGVP